MKKFLLSLIALVAICINASADQVTIEVSDALWTTEQEAQSGTKDGITIATTNGTLGSESYRCYKGQTFTITSSVGNISDVEFTCLASGTTKYGPGCFTGATAGTYTATEGTTGSWTGDVASFSLTASSNQVRISKIVVTYNNGDTKCSAPSLTPSSVFTLNAFAVTMTNNEAGSTVYYTLDGSDPTVNSKNFTGDLYVTNVTKTTTVKAMSVLEGKENSSITTATYTREESIANDSATAYSTQKIINLINAGSAQLKTTELYVKGIVCKADSNFNASYGNMSYYISEYGKADSTMFEIYRGYSFGGEKFVSASEIQVGDTVIVKGLATRYGTIYEFSAGSTLIYRTPHYKNTCTLTAIYKTSLNVNDIDSVIVNYNGDGQLTISSTNGNVADVDGGEGSTTYIGAYQEGTTTITITAAETDKYYGATITYTLNVTPKMGGLETFDNGGFENWISDKRAVSWQSSTSASSATIAYNQLARTGYLSAQITGSTSGNKRLGSKEYKLAAGTYTFEIYAMAVDTASAKVAAGYVIDTLNANGDYVANGSGYNYGDYVIVGSEWTRVYKTFVLTEETVINLVVMNHKSYGNDVLVDDALLRLATDEEKEALAISSVSADKAIAKGIYSVTGQRLNATRKGINIIDGKKVYIK